MTLAAIALAPQSVDQHNPLTDSVARGPTLHQNTLLLHAPNRNETHRGPASASQMASASVASFFCRFTASSRKLRHLLEFMHQRYQGTSPVMAVAQASIPFSHAAYMQRNGRRRSDEAFYE